MRGKCNECGWSGDFTGYSERELQNDVTEIGIECPNCSKWYHSHYLTSDLKELMTELKTSPSRTIDRKYKHKFEKVQKKLRKALGTEAPRMAGKDESSSPNDS